jgi:hypothetical protein
MGLRIDVVKLQGTQPRIVDDNRWAVLAMMEDDDVDIEPMADLLENTVREICEEVEVIKTPAEGVRLWLKFGANIDISICKIYN